MSRTRKGVGFLYANSIRLSKHIETERESEWVPVII